MLGYHFSPRLGEVYWIDFPNVGGHEQHGLRPGVIFQNNAGNEHSPNVIALPMTSSLKRKDFPTNVYVDKSETGLPCSSIVLCNNPQTIGKHHVMGYITALPDYIMQEIAICNLIASGAAMYLSEADLVYLRKKCEQLNLAFG